MVSTQNGPGATHLARDWHIRNHLPTLGQERRHGAARVHAHCGYHRHGRWPWVNSAARAQATTDATTNRSRVRQTRHRLTSTGKTQRAPAHERTRSKSDASRGQSFQREWRATTQQLTTRITLSHGARHTIANRSRRRSLGAEWLANDGPPHLSLCTNKALFLVTPITNARTRQFLYKCSSRYSVE